MDIYKVLQDTIQNSANNMHLTDYKIGTVIGIEPLKIKFDENKIIEDVGTNILCTEQVLEKKINIQHFHTIDCLSHKHNAVGLSHSHSTPEGGSGSSLSGSYSTTTYLDGAYASLTSLDGVVTVSEGIMLDDVLLILKVASGQKFIVLSKLRASKSVVIDKDNNWNWS